VGAGGNRHAVAMSKLEASKGGRKENSHCAEGGDRLYQPRSVRGEPVLIHYSRSPFVGKVTQHDLCHPWHPWFPWFPQPSCRRASRVTLPFRLLDPYAQFDT